VNLRFNISAGEFFELIRPAMLFLAAIISTGLLVHARKRFPGFSSFAWALATFAFLPVVLPLYVATLLLTPSRNRWLPRFPILLPVLYLLSLLAFISVYLLHDSSNADTHLARAKQAKLAGKPGQAISEYRQALALEDDAHTHKLLANELAESGYLIDALAEFRLAERKGEPDDNISFQIATLLQRLDHPNEAQMEYKRFVTSGSCLTLSDPRCIEATVRINALDKLIKTSPDQFR
jgi:tetratricopeptide (TPR) repeat protein